MGRKTEDERLRDSIAMQDAGRAGADTGYDPDTGRCRGDGNSQTTKDGD